MELATRKVAKENGDTMHGYIPSTFVEKSFTDQEFDQMKRYIPVDVIDEFEEELGKSLTADVWNKDKSFPVLLFKIACKESGFDPKVINQWILKVGRDEMDADDMAEEWVKNNMDTVNKWIK